MPDKEAALSPAEAVLRPFAIHNRIPLYLLDALPPEAWQATPPGGKGHTLAARAGHMHSVRLPWDGDEHRAKKMLFAKKSTAGQRLDASLHCLRAFEAIPFHCK